MKITVPPGDDFILFDGGTSGFVFHQHRPGRERPILKYWGGGNDLNAYCSGLVKYEHTQLKHLSQGLILEDRTRDIHKTPNPIPFNELARSIEATIRPTVGITSVIRFASNRFALYQGTGDWILDNPANDVPHADRHTPFVGSFICPAHALQAAVMRTWGAKDGTVAYYDVEREVMELAKAMWADLRVDNPIDPAQPKQPKQRKRKTAQ